MGSRLVVALVAAVLCVSVPASSPGAIHRPRLVVYGYDYAKQCPEAGPKDRVDRWGMYICNCTSYVAWALESNHQRTDWFVGGLMDAWNWPNIARRRHLRVGSRPKVGDVAVWPQLARPFGHVAYVTLVEPDGRFDVSEYNFPFRNESDRFSFDRRSHVSARGATFIEVPKR